MDNLDIKLDAKRKTKRVYQSPNTEVNLKISRSLKVSIHFSISTLFNQSFQTWFSCFDVSISPLLLGQSIHLDDSLDPYVRSLTSDTFANS